jgi:hypothetical protein
LRIGQVVIPLTTRAAFHRSRGCRASLVAGRKGSALPALLNSAFPRNGNYKHGRYTAEAIASRQWLREQIREVRGLAKRLRQL